MRKYIQNFNVSWVVMTLVIGIQFLLLPYYHYHPENVHAHADKPFAHEHEGHFHSLALENIAHKPLVHSEGANFDHNHTHPHSVPDEDQLDVEPNSTNTKPLKSNTVVKASAYFSSPNFQNIPETFLFRDYSQGDPVSGYWLKIRERSPPAQPLSI
jgi:hypothetical protein